jgi:hypothetical protein
MAETEVYDQIFLNKLAGYERTVRDLRVFFRGFQQGGGKLDLPHSAEEIQDALATAESLIRDYRNQRSKDNKKPKKA